jgi:hypothetical protein
MKSVFLFLVITFSTINANAQLGDFFRKLGDNIDSITKKNKVEEANKPEDDKVIKSDDSSEVFIKKDGQTIAQVNSESYIYCAGRARADRKYIVLDGSHPFIENIQIYKNTIFDESLSQNDFDLYKSRKCDEPLFFIDGKSISSAKVKELESAIPKEARDIYITEIKTKKEAELLELRRKELAEKAKFDALSSWELRNRLVEIQGKLASARQINDGKGGQILPPEMLTLKQEEEKIQSRLNSIESAESRQRILREADSKRIEKEKRDAEREKNDAANKITLQKAQRLREQCLSNGVIGICQSSSQNNTQYICDSNLAIAFENILNKYCYVTDNYSISTSMEVRNNSSKTIKDITFSCTQNAKSGTSLTSGNHTIYDVWGPNEAKSVSIKFIKHDQVQSMNCKAVTWK